MSVRDSAALLDAVSGPATSATRTSRPRRAGRSSPRSAPTPAGCGSASAPAPRGRRCRRIRTASPPLEDAVALLTDLGHEVVEAELPGLGPEVGSAIGTVFNAATAWIVGYWTRRLGRAPADDELEPLTRAYWELGRQVTAADYLLAIEECQRFARGVAGLARRTSTSG